MPRFRGHKASHSRSTSSPSGLGYDVFLSFRGEDTRKNFTDHLYTALVNARFRTFRDEPELERGENIKESLENAIQESRSSVIVFSKHYTSSRWCLDELVMILERKRASEHVLLPVFYDVNPSQLRKQAESLGRRHSGVLARLYYYFILFLCFNKKKQSPEKLSRWAEALKEVADLAGMVLENQADGHESKFIQTIVREIQKKLDHLGDSLSATADHNSSWLSPSGDFAFRKKPAKFTHSDLETNLRSFSHKELEEATNGFNEVLGKGSFGVVYKGIIQVGSGVEVAVKKLKRVIEDGVKEFKTELNILGKTRHKNLVHLVGYCDQGQQRLLVYEFLSNGTLASFIFSDEKPCWRQRMEIAYGVARGLLYLHEECTTQIIHCDIKPQNILLDDHYSARISDFGLAKLMMMNQSRTHTTIKGTNGYFAPEWFRNMAITTKVDVYSFGVVLLEIICCRRSVDMENKCEEKAVLTDWVYDCYRGGVLELVLDHEVNSLDGEMKLEETVMIALWCIQEDPSLRPTMRKVVQMLEGVVEIHVPPCPSPYNRAVISSWLSPSGDFAFRKKPAKFTHSDLETNLRSFSHKELEIATNGFNEVLGKGSSGVVYKGIIKIGSGVQVAVKKLNSVMQDSVIQESEIEFKTELKIIRQTHHKNLVHLVGYCDEGQERLLVYEFFSNGTLASFLFGDEKPSWRQRMEIAYGVAKGLLYLHEECSTQIIHCDIKPQNILLDDHYNARISDFGLSKLLMMNQSQTYTAIRGTKGYVAPEWFRNIGITTKVDVYSFGVVLLEIICCRRSVDIDNTSEEKAILTDWVYNCYQDGLLDEVLNHQVNALDDKAELEKTVMIALWCIQEDPFLRPTIRKVVQMLEGVVEVHVPPCPSPYSSREKLKLVCLV